MSSTACIVCMITMRYSGAAARSSSSPGVMLRSRRAVTGIAMQGLGGTRRSPPGAGQKATALGGEGHREPVAGLPPHGVGDSAVRDPSGTIDSPDGVQHGSLARQAGEVAERHRAPRLRCPAQGGQGQGLDDLLPGGSVVLHVVNVHRSYLLADCVPRAGLVLDRRASAAHPAGQSPPDARPAPSELRELPAGNAQPVIYPRPVMPDASARICGLAWSGGI